MLKAYKYRIYPNTVQKIQIAKTFGCCRFVYNQTLAYRKEAYEKGKKSVSKTDCNNYCNRQLKKEYEWLKEVDKFALTNAIYHMDAAYQKFFKEHAGYPKFKSKHDNHKSYTTNFTNGNIRVDFECNRVKLPKLKDVKAKLEEQDAVIIAVSEGVKNKDGRYISEEVQSSAVDSFGHSYIAGAAKVLEDAVRNEIGCKVRSIELNLMQRCAAHLASATDIQESRMLGKTACQYALEGATGMMAAVIRTSDKPYATEFKALPVCDIANAIKSVPADYINDAGNDVTEKMVDYLTPLIQGEMNTVYENGIPKYIYLY